MALALWAAAVVCVAVVSVAGVVDAAHHGAGAAATLWESIPAPLEFGSDAVQASMDAETRGVQLTDAATDANSQSIAAAQAQAQAQYQAELAAQEEARDARFASRRAKGADADADADADAEDSDSSDSDSDSDEHSADLEANGAASDPSSLMQIKSAAEMAADAARRPRGIGHIALPRLDGTMTRVDYARKLWRERIRRRLRGGGMMRRYAPEMFGADIYGMDENDNVKIGSRATIWDAMNGPFAPMPKPSSVRPKPSPEAVKFAMLRDAQKHRALDDKQKIRHTEYYLKNDPHAGAYTYLPKNHRNPFGLNKIFLRARRDQGLDVGPFDGPRFRHQYANPTNVFSQGSQRHQHLPLPSNPRLPWAEADASIAGMRPSKLQEFREFQPPPKIPKMVASPPADKSDATDVGKGDTPDF